MTIRQLFTQALEANGEKWGDVARYHYQDSVNFDYEFDNDLGHAATNKGLGISQLATYGTPVAVATEAWIYKLEVESGNLKVSSEEFRAPTPEEVTQVGQPLEVLTSSDSHTTPSNAEPETIAPAVLTEAQPEQPAPTDPVPADPAMVDPLSQPEAVPVAEEPAQV